jgi:hypothetical protein
MRLFHIFLYQKAGRWRNGRPSGVTALEMCLNGFTALEMRDRRPPVAFPSRPYEVLRGVAPFSSHSVRRIEEAARFEDSVGKRKELAHRSGEDGHLGLTSGT